jgi:hypothetical protein
MSKSTYQSIKELMENGCGGDCQECPLENKMDSEDVLLCGALSGLNQRAKAEEVAG